MPSTISVQAFTPILGTLLLSSNLLVGGAARYAVVHLLSRMKRADDLNAGDPTTPIYLSAEICQDEDETEWVTGLFGRNERDMFRTEILQQVVIGMGRLDMDVDDQCDLDDLSREYQQDTNDKAIVANGEENTGDTSSERSEIARAKDTDLVNPYFPLLASSFSAVSPSNSAVSTLSSPLSSSSLDPALPSITDHFSQNQPVEDITIRDDWMPSAPRPSHRTLPPPRNSTPWSSPDLSNSAQLTSSAESASDSRHFYSDEFGSNGGYNFHEGPSNSYFQGTEDGEPDDQAAVGRLSSMSLMAAVAASGLFGAFLFLVLTPHLYCRLSG